ncbi:GNAT family N-acetyltransferase [Roseomonas sp. CCTCC AB2023176]|uniref:GNAT family N-acetyltransferase n=1 Tax=Roseomonas sp. CCTCC AB2023176 TaxID=3342640 RepID=UPI0035D66477
MLSPGSKAPLRFRRVSRADTAILGRIPLDPALVTRFLGSLDAVSDSVRKGVAHVLVIAESAGRPMGFTVTHPDPGSGGCWWVAYLAVADRARGQGLGRQLLSRALRALSAVPGCREIRLLVDPENGPARRLYAAMGFVSADETVGPEEVFVLRLRPAAPERRPRPRAASPFTKRRRLRVRPNPGPHAARVIGLTRGPPAAA